MMNQYQRSNLLLIFTFAGFLVVTLPLQGDLSYSFAFDQAVYSGPAGGQVDVALLLGEVTTDGTPTRLGDPGNGLIAAGAIVNFNVSPLPTDPAQIQSVGDVIPNPGFDVADLTLVSGVQLEMSLLDLGNITGSETTPGSGVFEATIATMTFYLGNVIGESTIIEQFDLDIGLDNTVLGDGTVLDGIPGAGAVIVVVPEPGLTRFAGLLGALLLVRRRRT